jgi:hypothetical protein
LIIAAKNGAIHSGNNSSWLKSGTIVAGDQAVMREKDINENSCFMNINAIKAMCVSLFWLHSKVDIRMHITCTLAAFPQSKVK